jgi:hypothetical protein
MCLGTLYALIFTSAASHEHAISTAIGTLYTLIFTSAASHEHAISTAIGIISSAQD